MAHLSTWSNLPQTDLVETLEEPQHMLTASRNPCSLAAEVPGAGHGIPVWQILVKDQTEWLSQQVGQVQRDLEDMATRSQTQGKLHHPGPIRKILLHG